MLKGIVSLAATAWGFAWATAWTLLWGVVYLCGAPFDRNARFMDFVQRVYMRGMLGGLGLTVRVEGAENVPRGRAVVVMPNHASYLDIPALVVALRELAIRFVAKRELKVIPFLGWALAASHHIKIDRGDRSQAILGLRRGAAAMRPGQGLVIFPEGTRSPTEALLPFKKGGFHLALETGLPILPVSIRGTGRILGKSRWFLRPGSITVIVHPPVAVEGREDPGVASLLAEVRSAILSGLPEASAREAAGPEGTRGKASAGRNGAGRDLSGKTT